MFVLVNQADNSRFFRSLVEETPHVLQAMVFDDLTQAETYVAGWRLAEEGRTDKAGNPLPLYEPKELTFSVG